MRRSRRRTVIFVWRLGHKSVNTTYGSYLGTETPAAQAFEHAESEMKALTAKIDKERTALRASAVEDALERSLKAAGVKGGLLKGATLLLRDAYKFEVDDTADEWVVSPRPTMARSRSTAS